MTESRDFLVEIGTEELPPKALPTLEAAFREALVKGLEAAGLAPSGAHSWAAPRRLAVLARDVPLSQPDRETERRGPALSAAFDEDGNPTKAALGFAQSCGISIDEIGKIETDKGAWIAYRSIEAGRPAAELLPGIVEKALAALPIPRRMRWGDGDAEFVRPAHWVVLLHGDAVVPGTVLGIPAGRETRGHRFHHPQPIRIAEPAAYAPLLETEGHVMPDFAARREAILGQVQEAASRLGGRALIPDALLDEVTALVEWPCAVSGTFEERFLAVPQEALIGTMQDNQKYFAVVDEAGRLMPHFVTVANIESREPERVSEGNARVIRPRLADAEFFWDRDRRTPLEARLEGLKTVVFQHGLGSLHDKAERIARLAGRIAPRIGVDRAHAERAARLAKCDLQTLMVYEFPELQGVMGRHYALHDGEPEDVAWAIEEHYLPRHAGDALPERGTGRAVALADRLDTLVGIFAAGLKPTGDKDPYALRRAALGIVRILVEGGLDLDLAALIDEAAEGLSDRLDARPVTGEVFDFAMERLRGYFAERGIAYDTLDAVLACRPTRPCDIERRLRAVEHFRQLPEAASLAAAHKRIHNLLKKVEGELPSTVDPARFAEPAEGALHAELERLERETGPLFDGGDYEPALTLLAALQTPVDAFFDGVMVMAEDAGLRNNRLALLNRLSALFLKTADLSRLQ